MRANGLVDKTISSGTSNCSAIFEARWKLGLPGWAGLALFEGADGLMVDRPLR